MLQNWGYKKVLAGSNWQSCGMQVRVEGSVEKVPEEESEIFPQPPTRKSAWCHSQQAGRYSASSGLKA